MYINVMIKWCTVKGSEKRTSELNRLSVWQPLSEVERMTQGWEVTGSSPLESEITIFTFRHTEFWQWFKSASFVHMKGLKHSLEWIFAVNHRNNRLVVVFKKCKTECTLYFSNIINLFLFYPMHYQTSVNCLSTRHLIQRTLLKFYDDTKFRKLLILTKERQ